MLISVPVVVSVSISLLRNRRMFTACSRLEGRVQGISLDVRRMRTTEQCLLQWANCTGHGGWSTELGSGVKGADAFMHS